MTFQAIEYWRLFVAVSLPAEVRNAIQRTQSAIRQSAPKEGISWTRSGQFHLTLKFLGDVASGSVPALVEGLRSAAAGFRPLPLQSSGLGFFPNARNPRVLWVGITDAGGHLVDLQAHVETTCANFCAGPAENRFHAHVTLARVKRPQGRTGSDLAAAIAPHQDRIFGNWTATHLELIRSQLSSTEAAYTELARLPFSVA